MTEDAIDAAPRTRFALGAGPRRLVSITVLAVLTLVPIVMVSSLVGDREGRETDVQQTITKGWGPAQVVGGPTLAVPVAEAGGALGFVKIAPRTLDIKASLAPERRHRGIFAATVYTATIEMSGTFTLPPTSTRRPGEAGGAPDLAGALIALPVSALDGIEAGDGVRIGATRSSWQLCADRLSVEPCRDATVLVAAVDAFAAKGGDLAFAATLHLRGAQALSLALAGKEVAATIAGAWPSPSFTGNLLPTETRSSGGIFEARWQRHEIGRPRVSTGSTVYEDAALNGIGVDLIEATPVYRMIERTTKYALLVVVLAFTTYFLLELVAGIRMTLLHYALLAASLSLFTLLLLSVSELLGYPAGYALSAALVVVQASLYTASVARRTRPTLVFAGTLAGLFGFLYVLLGLESYALVVGAMALFVLLSVVMAATQSLQPAAAR